MKSQIVVLGATGSIGCQLLDVVSEHPEAYAIYALVARRNVAGLFAQCMRFTPEYAVMTDESAAQLLQQRITQAGLKTTVLSGQLPMVELCQAADVDIVVAAIVGAAGLLPTFAAAQAGKTTICDFILRPTPLKPLHA